MKVQGRDKTAAETAAFDLVLCDISLLLLPTPWVNFSKERVLVRAALRPLAAGFLFHGTREGAMERSLKRGDK